MLIKKFPILFSIFQFDCNKTRCRFEMTREKKEDKIIYSSYFYDASIVHRRITTDRKKKLLSYLYQ